METDWQRSRAIRREYRILPDFLLSRLFQICWHRPSFVFELTGAAEIFLVEPAFFSFFRFDTNCYIFAEALEE